MLLSMQVVLFESAFSALQSTQLFNSLDHQPSNYRIINCQPTFTPLNIQYKQSDYLSTDNPDFVPCYRILKNYYRHVGTNACLLVSLRIQIINNFVFTANNKKSPFLSLRPLTIAAFNHLIIEPEPLSNLAIGPVNKSFNYLICETVTQSFDM